MDPNAGVPDVAALKERLRAAGAPVVEAAPPAPDLRVVVPADGAGYVCFHEGARTVRTTLRPPGLPADACWATSTTSGTTLPPPLPDALGAGDRTAVPARRRFAGSVRYVAEVDVPDGDGAARLDLGAVGDAATVTMNGTMVGHALAGPYVVDMPAGALRAGPNVVEVLVSNDAAVYDEGGRHASGLVGPVTLTS